MATTRSIAAASILALACGSRGAAEAPEPKQGKTVACAAAEAVPLEETGATAVVIAIADGWGFVVLGADGGARVVPVDASGRRAGPTRVVEAPGAPFVLRATRDHRVLVSAEADADGALTLHARALGREVDGPLVSLEIGAIDEALAAAVADDRLALAHRTREGRVQVALFDVGAEGVLAASLVEVGTAEHPVHELLALAVRDGAYAFVYRTPHGDHAEGPVVVATSDGRASPADALFEAIAVEGFAIEDGGALAALATFEHDPPALVRFAADGQSLGEPVTVVLGDETPPPFTGRLRATLGGASDELVVHVETIAGHALGPSVELAKTESGPLRGDVTRAGEGFVVAVLDEGEGLVETRRIECPVR